MSRQIKVGAIISYFSLAINTLLAFIYLPWMISVIGKSDYALYSLAFSLISIFMIDFGLSAAVSRFITKFNAEGQTEKVNSFLQTVETLYTIISSVIFFVLIVFYFFIERIYTGLSATEIHTFKMLYIVVMIYSIISFPCMTFPGILNAYEKFIELKICDLTQRLLSAFLTIICLISGGGVRSVVMCTAVSGGITIVVRYLIIYKKTPVRIRVGKIDRDLFRDIFSFSIWITIISLAQRCIFNIAPSVLGIVSNSEEIAVFAPANTLENFFYMLASAVNGLFLPTISRYIAENDKKKIDQLMVKVGRYQFIVLSFVYVGFFCVGQDFMIAWMGNDFIKTYPCVLLLFFPDILLFSQQIANTTAIAQNKVKEQAFGYICMAGICVVISFLLCRVLGSLGSAIGISTSYLFLFIYLSILYRQRLGLNIKRLFKECYFHLGPFIILAGLSSFFICSFILLNNLWVRIIVKAIITSIIYFLFIIFRLNQEEKNFVKNIFHKNVVA